MNSTTTNGTRITGAPRQPTAVPARVNHALASKNHDRDIVDKIFKSRAWLDEIIEKGGYPILVGDDLPKLLQGADSSVKVALAVLGEKCSSSVQLRSRLISSLRGHVDKNELEVKIDALNLALNIDQILVGNVLQREPLVVPGSDEACILHLHKSEEQGVQKVEAKDFSDGINRITICDAGTHGFVLFYDNKTMTREVKNGLRLQEPFVSM